MSAEVNKITYEQKQPELFYVSPKELLAQSSEARRTLQMFMSNYLHFADESTALAPLERAERRYQTEFITGYTDLGELIHVRVDPLTANSPDDFVVAVGSLGDGCIEEVDICRVDKWQDAARGGQVRLWLNQPGAEAWPEEYQPSIHLSIGSFRPTYSPGFGRATSLIRPIEGLMENYQSDDGDKAKILTFNPKNGTI